MPKSVAISFTKKNEAKKAITPKNGSREKKRHFRTNWAHQ